MRSACRSAEVIGVEPSWYVVATVAAGAVLDTTSDAELARRIMHAGQERAAEAELCRRFAPRVRLYGLKHLRDEDRARDLVQVVLVAMIEAIRAGRVEDPERVDRFVLGMCRNLAGRARYHEARAIVTDVEELDLASVMPS